MRTRFFTLIYRVQKKKEHINGHKAASVSANAHMPHTHSLTHIHVTKKNK